VDRLNSFVLARTEYSLAIDALGDFRPFPRWVRTAEMLDFLGWLRTYNDQFSGEAHKVHVQAIGGESPRKTVIWEHSANVGDARATDQPQPSLGQLARTRYGRGAALVSFNTFTGTTLAAGDGDGPPRRQMLPPAPVDSIEALCHALEIPRFCIPLRGISDSLADALRAPLVERMLQGDQCGFVRARLVDQFDALVYFDETRSLEPLEPTARA
jgi:erythromycin esterase-like protein